MATKRHVLVPEAEILPKDKTAELLEKFGFKMEQLPQIAKDDPMTTNLKAKKGDVIKITRDSMTAGKAFYYRVVG